MSHSGKIVMFQVDTW